MTLAEDIVRRVDPVDQDQELHEFLRDLERELAMPVAEGRDIDRVVTLDTVARRDLPIATKAGTLAVPAPKVEAPADPAEAAELLLNSNARAVLVYADGEYAGLVTEKSLLRSADLSAVDVPVDRIMNPPITVRHGATVGDARGLLRKHGFGRLPVTDAKGRLVGLVDRSGLLALERPKKAHRRLGDRSAKATRDIQLEIRTVMDGEPLTVPRGTPVSAVASRMAEWDTTCAVVVDGDRPVGIVTTVDVLELLLAQPPRQGVYIQVTGQQALAPYERERLHAVLDTSVRKVASMYEGTEYLYVHVKRRDRDGQRSRWQVRTRLFTPVGMFFSRSAGYELPTVADDAMGRLGRLVRKRHERKTRRRVHAVPRPKTRRGGHKRPTEAPFRSRRTP